MDIYFKFQPGTDKLKLWALYCVEDDEEFRLARVSTMLHSYELTTSWFTI